MPWKTAPELFHAMENPERTGSLNPQQSVSLIIITETNRPPVQLYSYCNNYKNRREEELARNVAYPARVQK